MFKLAPNILVGGAINPGTPIALPFPTVPLPPVPVENSGSVHSFDFGRNIKRFLPLKVNVAPLIVFLVKPNHLAGKL